MFKEEERDGSHGKELGNTSNEYKLHGQTLQLVKEEHEKVYQGFSFWQTASPLIMIRLNISYKYSPLS